jgi:hypothetical protein
MCLESVAAKESRRKTTPKLKTKQPSNVEVTSHDCDSGVFGLCCCGGGDGGGVS